MKRIIKLSLVAVFACVAGYNVYQSQTSRIVWFDVGECGSFGWWRRRGRIY